MEQHRKPVFLSHSSKNVNQMKELASYLEERDIPCWYAPRNIAVGDKYDLRIAIDLEENVECVVVLITEEVAESEMVPKELIIACKYNKKVIPIILDGSSIPKSLEFVLANIHWIDTKNYETDEDALDDLVAILEMGYQGTDKETQMVSNNHVRKPVLVRQSSSSSLYKVDAMMHQKINEVFEPPFSFGKMENLLKKHHFLHVYNPHHVGKYTTAIALLDKIGAYEVFEWSKEMTLTEILSHPIKKESGFIIEIESSDEFYKALSEHELERFIGKLSDNNAYLVVLSKEQSTMDTLLNLSIRMELPTDNIQILINHTNYLEVGEIERNAMLDWIGSEKAEELLKNELFPRYAAEYVHNIHLLITGEINESAFFDSLEVNVSKRVKDWFKQSYTIRDISFYLTSGLLQGHSYQAIIEESTGLVECFYKHFQQDSIKGALIPSRDEYLQHFHTEVRQVWKQTNVGREQMEGVYFLFQQDIKVVWETIWMQYPSYQKPIVSWLKSLFHKSNRVVQNIIIDIIVHLAKKDSQNVRNQLIVPWAKSDDYKERLFATRILEALAEDEDFLHMVFTLTRSWVRQSNNDRLQWTALVVLGSKVGGAYYTESLNLLKEIYGLANLKKLSSPFKRSFEQLCQLTFLSNEHEELFFRFWVGWFKNMDEKQLVELLQFSHTIFLTQPRLFFDTKSERQNEFWKEYLRISYQKFSTRKSVEGLINQWIIVASGNRERQLRISELLYSLYVEENEENQERLEKFVEKGLIWDDKYYRPIYDQLLLV